MLLSSTSIRWLLLYLRDSLFSQANEGEMEEKWRITSTKSINFNADPTSRVGRIDHFKDFCWSNLSSVVCFLLLLLRRRLFVLSLTSETSQVNVISRPYKWQADNGWNKDTDEQRRRSMIMFRIAHHVLFLQQSNSVMIIVERTMHGSLIRRWTLKCQLTNHCFVISVMISFSDIAIDQGNLVFESLEAWINLADLRLCSVELTVANHLVSTSSWQVLVLFILLLRWIERAYTLWQNTAQHHIETRTQPDRS